MFYIYILQSLRDSNFYVGYTNDLKNRKNKHDKGLVDSTKNRRPLQLLYYEACFNQQDATHREKYLKTAWGKRYIKSRLKNYLALKNSAPENKVAARKGGKISGDARKKLESETGKKVSTKKNFLKIKTKNRLK